LNILPPDVWVKASDTIKDQIALIKILEKKGFTYRIKDGIYFDSSKLKTYGRLWPKKIEIKAGARVRMVPGKKNPTDFALWKFSPPKIKRQMEWDSPWGKGFPGWHTECVAMAKKYLGIPFDIHCGGIDHILIHHTNEIAQGEAAFGKILAKFWLHGEFLNLPKGRMGKSEGNIIILDNLIKNGFNPLSFRYLCLSTHYCSTLTFSLKILKASQNGLNALFQRMLEIKPKRKIDSSLSDSSRVKAYKKEFLELINDDLNTPKALALTWEVVKNKKLTNQEKYWLLLDFDKVFALDLAKVRKVEIPYNIKKLVEERERYRKKREWEKSDELRERIKKLGYWVEDTRKGPKIKKL
jgi:cysteinyl-tRNA synthetase